MPAGFESGFDLLGSFTFTRGSLKPCAMSSGTSILSAEKSVSANAEVRVLFRVAHSGDPSPDGTSPNRRMVFMKVSRFGCPRNPRRAEDAGAKASAESVA